MGLDQYATAYSQDGGRTELMYWRKHPNLQGYMEQLWEDKGRLCFTHFIKGELKEDVYSDDSNEGWGHFNCIPLVLNPDDINDLEECVLNSKLPHTTGFFFGESRDEDKESDLKFIELAREAHEEGDVVVYNSSW